LLAAAKTAALAGGLHTSERDYAAMKDTRISRYADIYKSI
jgi:hypothetical protein